MTVTDGEFNASLPREGLAFLHVQQTVRDFERERSARMQREVMHVEGQTLDLSMPKKRDVKDQGQGATNNQQVTSVGSQGPAVGSHLHGLATTAYAPPPPPAHSKGPITKTDPYRITSSALEQMGASGGFALRASTPQYPPRSTPPSQNARPPTGGSIMQGTPLLNAPLSTNSHLALPPSSIPSLQQVARATDGLLRPALQGRDLSGSITQGTPIVLIKDGPSPHPADRHGDRTGPVYDHASTLGFYKTTAPSQTSSLSSSGVGSATASSGGAGTAPGRVSYQQAEQQLTANHRQQIILSDYLTSQQMVIDRPGREPRSRGDQREVLTPHPQPPVTPGAPRESGPPRDSGPQSRASDRGAVPGPPASHVIYPYPSHAFMPKMTYIDQPLHPYLPTSSSAALTAPHNSQVLLA